MEQDSIKPRTPIHDEQRQPPERTSGPLSRLIPSPLAVGVGALACLVLGLLYLSLQVREIFSDQLQQEYAALVLESISRAETAQSATDAWHRLPQDPASATGYQNALAALRDRVAEMESLVTHSPVPVPRFARDVPITTTSLDAVRYALTESERYWRGRYDTLNTDLRHRTLHIGYALAVLTVVVVGALLNALVVYVRRQRRLAGMTHRLAHAAQHDAMTGLLNRQALFSALENRVPTTRGDGPPPVLALIYLDLDGFKQVNDRLGHAVGDQFLVSVANRFRQSLRPGDLLARLGGDEFAVLVGSAGKTELTIIARRLLACVKETDTRMGLGLVSASIGIASYPDPFPDHRLLVAAADKAMYDVKRSGKNGIAFAAPVE
jgi:diguanylate cyclase (GGDEF)-like protein